MKQTSGVEKENMLGEQNVVSNSPCGRLVISLSRSHLLGSLSMFLFILNPRASSCQQFVTITLPTHTSSLEQRWPGP